MYIHGSILAKKKKRKGVNYISIDFLTLLCYNKEVMDTLNKINKIDQTNMNFNRVKKPEQKKYTKEQIKRHRKFGAGALAAVIATGGFMLGSNKENIIDSVEQTKNSIKSNFQTLDQNTNEAPIEARSINGLDNKEIDFDNYTKIILDDEVEITLNEGDPVRATDVSHAGRTPDDLGPSHSSVFIAKEDINFTLSDGETIYQNKDGQIVAKIDNFTQTADGLETGLKTDVDKDGWVFVDTPNRIDNDQE